YRFRTPYTAAQGAKNRLAEALAWELVERGIKSVATNPGPVHSDRIYKTVYPKAAAEFLRVGGYPGLDSSEIEVSATKGLDLLGEPPEVFSKGIKEIAQQVSSSRSSVSSTSSTSTSSTSTSSTSTSTTTSSSTSKPADSNTVSSSLTTNQDDLTKTVEGMLMKIQEIAEKIQKNTSKMIVDNEFLSQEEVADMVLTLSDNTISKLINGRIIPNDRVFYPVKPIVGTSIDDNNLQNLKEKVVVITTTSSKEKDVQRITSLANRLNDSGVKQVIILSKNNDDDTKFYRDFHSHSLDLSDEEKVKRIFNTAKTKFGSIDSVIHVTGEYDYNRSLLSLSREEWDILVENFIHIPALITREAVKFMSPPDAIQKPSQFKDSKGIIVILGPDSPYGKKISGLIRARSEVFRGALRPYTATVNQELSDVLGSKITLNLILPGNVEGIESTIENVTTSVLNLIAGSSLNKNESIFYIDEGKKEK
ncbi:MAG: SDR family oxidoreductase, partial [Nitrososphaeraceae archaeon]